MASYVLGVLETTKRGHKYNNKKGTRVVSYVSGGLETTKKCPENNNNKGLESNRKNDVFPQTMAKKYIVSTPTCSHK